jgi:hypothetical protein
MNMQKTMAAFALLACIGTGVAAQETYGELYEKGSLTLSNMEQHLADVLRDHGVPDSCLAQLTVSDASNMQLIINGDDSREDKRRQVKAILDRKCG